MRDLTTRRWVVSELWLTSYKTWDVSDTLSSVDDIQFISAMYCQSYGCFILDHGHPISFSCISVLIYASVIDMTMFSYSSCTRTCHLLVLTVYSYSTCTGTHHVLVPITCTRTHHVLVPTMYSCPSHVLVLITYSYPSCTRVGPAAGGGAASSSAVDLQQFVVRRRRRHR